MYGPGLHMAREGRRKTTDEPSQQRAGTRSSKSRVGGDARVRFPAPAYTTHLLDRLSIVYRYRYVAVSVLLLIVLGTMLRTFTTTPLYRAQARLMIEMEDEQEAALAGALSRPSTYYWEDPQVYYQTQYRILTGRELALRVVRSLDLARVPEFNADGPTPPRLSRIISTLTSKMLRSLVLAARRGRMPRHRLSPNRRWSVSSSRECRSSRCRTAAWWMCRSSRRTRRSLLAPPTRWPRNTCEQNLALRRQNDGHEPRVAVAGVAEAAAEGRGERARHGAVSRGSECALPRGTPEYRRRAAQSVERRRHQGEDEPGAEEDPLRSGQRSGRRRDR